MNEGEKKLSAEIVPSSKLVLTAETPIDFSVIYVRTLIGSLFQGDLDKFSVSISGDGKRVVIDGPLAKLERLKGFVQRAELSREDSGMSGLATQLANGITASISATLSATFDNFRIFAPTIRALYTTSAAYEVIVDDFEREKSPNVLDEPALGYLRKLDGILDMKTSSHPDIAGKLDELIKADPFIYEDFLKQHAALKERLKAVRPDLWEKLYGMKG